jgi:hypothetical protein
MSKEGLDHIVFSKNVVEFVTVANEYCTFVEQHTRITRQDFIKKAQKILPLLYLKTTLLPEVDLPDEGIPEKFVTEVDYNFLLNKLSEKLGQFDSYQEVFDEGMQFSETALDASIAENLCDIYQDLKDFIMVYRLGNTDIMTEALIECRHNFETYWGQKLVNCLRALHLLVYGSSDLNENDQQIHQNSIPENKKNKNWVSNHFANNSENPFDIE